jgi:outer membrane protein
VSWRWCAPKTGLLPRLELFVNLGKSGYADSFGGAVSDLGRNQYDARVGFSPGISPGQPRGQRPATGAPARTRAGEKALDNLNQLVELDIRNAYLEVNRTREQISAGAATRQWQEEKLRIETEKFRVGRSTNLLVAQAQRDLLVSRIDEVRAVVDYLKALTDLYRSEGILLERRGIDMPFDPALRPTTKGQYTYLPLGPLQIDDHRCQLDQPNDQPNNCGTNQPLNHPPPAAPILPLT